jgi:FkbM family methyltransferase
MKKLWSGSRKDEPGENVRPPVFTQVPGLPPIELVAYYDEFRDYYPECEMNTKGWFVRNVRLDWVILDCGANIGYYTILFARLAPEGRVYSFEPTITYEMLLTNLAHHQINNVTPLKLALGKSTGQIEDSIFRIWGKEPEKMVYSFTTIDDFIATNQLRRLDCIKIDVDSFDFEVLQGARETLIKHDPFVVVELNHALSRRNQSVPQALEWLAGMGYKTAFSLDYDNFLLKRNLQSVNTGTNGLQIIIQFGQK